LKESNTGYRSAKDSLPDASVVVDEKINEVKLRLENIVAAQRKSFLF
jgi:hypothetical protein